MTPQEEQERYRYLQLKQKMGNSGSAKHYSDKEANEILPPWKRKLAMFQAASNALPDSPATMIQKGLQNAGGYIAEKMGEKGYPKTGVALGAIPTFLPQALSMLSPEGAGSKVTMLKPNIPEARQAAVSAAGELGVPLTRAEQTGSMLGAGFESGLEKTPLGARPIQQFREQQAAALQKAKEGLQGKMGTTADVFPVGQKALGGLESRDSAIKKAKDALFAEVPDNVRIEFPQAKNMADTLMDEQSKLYQGTQSPEVTRWSKIVSDAESSTGAGVTGGPEFKGVTTDIPAQTSPETTRTVTSQLLNEKGKPITYQQKVPGTTTPASKKFGIQASVSPEQSFAAKPNYFPIKKMRENLGQAIREAKTAKRFNDYRDLSRLMDSLDKDLANFASKPASPLDSLVAKTWKENYRKANAFSGAYKNLFQGNEAEALRDTPAERIVDTVFKKNNETGIKQFRALVGDDGFQPAKQYFTQNLLESKNILNDLRKYKPGTLRAIYSQPELNQITKYGLAQSLAKGAEKMAGNPSGTGRQVTTAGTFGGVGAALATGHPIVAGTVLGGPYAAAKAYLSNAMRSGVTFNPQTQRILQGLLAAMESAGRNQQNANPHP